jgi:gamma-glutamyltranspeptidase/glutathione hydrolase
MSTHGMAATSHPAPTLTAVNVLQQGGNAMDTAVAACAAQRLVEPGSTGIGGDCFALFASKGGPSLVAFNGSGRAPAAASAEERRSRPGPPQEPKHPVPFLKPSTDNRRPLARKASR